ncbi:hypothetical protein [Geodermatophilus sp. URMC 63]
MRSWSRAVRPDEEPVAVLLPEPLPGDVRALLSTTATSRRCGSCAGAPS